MTNAKVKQHIIANNGNFFKFTRRRDLNHLIFGRFRLRRANTEDSFAKNIPTKQNTTHIVLYMLKLLEKRKSNSVGEKKIFLQLSSLIM